MKLAFESLAGLPTEPMTALQFSRYAAEFLPEGEPGTNLVVGISVSGQVSRTLEAMQRAKKAGATVIALSGTPGSRIALAGDRFLPMTLAPFEFSPGVRSYIATVLMLYLVALLLGEVRGRLASSQAADVRQEITSFADAVERTMAMCDEPARRLAEDWRDANEYVVRRTPLRRHRRAILSRVGWGTRCVGRRWHFAHPNERDDRLIRDTWNVTALAAVSGESPS